MSENNKKYCGKQREVVYFRVNEYYGGTKNKTDILTDFIVACIKSDMLKIKNKTDVILDSQGITLYNIDR